MCLFMSFFYTSDYVDHAYHMVEYYDTAELDTFSALYGGQYLKPGTDTQLFHNEVKGKKHEGNDRYCKKRMSYGTVL